MSLEQRITALAQAIAADIKSLLAWQAAPTITAGSIDGTPVGTNVPSSGAFTRLSATESGTGSGNGGLISNTASANGNSGLLIQTNGANRWSLTTFGADGEFLRIYNYALGLAAAIFGPTGLAVAGKVSASAAGGFYLDQVGVRSWNVTATSGNMNIRSGDGLGRVVLNDKAILDAPGNLGLGVAPSVWGGGKGIEYHYSALYAPAGDVTAYLTNAYSNDAGVNWKYKYPTLAAATMYRQIAGRHEFYSAPSGTAGTTIAFAQLWTTQTTATAPGANGSACVLSMRQDSTTSRSINAAGTINAAGADYAEYERNGGLKIAKGQLVGFKSDGSLTLTFADAVRFGVKSTAPCLVGGDTWGAASDVGTRPEAPVFIELEYQGCPEPGDEPQPPQPPQVDATEAQQAAYANAKVAYMAALVAHQQKQSLHRIDKKTHEARNHVARHLFDTVTHPEYLRALGAFETRLETARQGVDRIGYCGKMPCNILGAAPGDYVVPVAAADGGIDGHAVPDANITFAQYRRAVGRVNRILPDGRAEIALIVH